MKPDCIPCTVRLVLQAARFASKDEEVHMKVLKRVLEFMAGADWSSSPLMLAFTVHKLIRDISGSRDPYAGVKRESNDLALKLYPELRKVVEGSRDRVETAVKLTAAGNVLDFGALESPDLMKTIRSVLEQELVREDYRLFREKAMEAESLIYFLDNAGEIVFDKLLIETLIEERGRPYRKLTIVVKGGPLINDATPEDAEYVGLNKLPNSEIRRITNGEEGTGPWPNSPEVRSWFKEHDMVVLKGQGNFEIYEEERGVFFILIAKCQPVADALRVKPLDIVLKFSGESD